MNTHRRFGKASRLVATFVTACLINTAAHAVDDGARTYWKGRAGTNVFSTQYLNLNMQASDALVFDPAGYIYPSADVGADIFLATYARHMTLMGKPSVLSFNLIGGSVDAEFDTEVAPSQFLPPGVLAGDSFQQSASGYGDPSAQLDVNIFGTPPLNAGFDLLNYEPTWTLDVAVMLAVPLGQYNDDKIVNLGLNRFYGRIALPFKYHFRIFTRGYMSSIEVVPSVWLFAKNNDFVGQDLKNDPLWQLEAHWTHDFTRRFYGSIDLLYRRGFQSEIDGTNIGEKLELGNVGFTLNYQIDGNIALRTSFSSNVFGNSDIDTSLVRLQFVYAWNRANQNYMKLGRE